MSDWQPRLQQEVLVETCPPTRGLVTDVNEAKRTAWVRIGRELPVELPWVVLRDPQAVCAAVEAIALSEIPTAAQA